MSKKPTGLAAQTRRMQGHAKTASGIAAGSTVLTLEGALPVEHLTPGDRIITRGGIRTLKALTVNVHRDAQVIRIGDSTLGPDRPIDELIVARDQKIMVRDWRAKAMFGAERAVVEARRLTDGEYIRAETVPELRLFTLDLGAPAVIYVNAQELALEPQGVTA